MTAELLRRAAKHLHLHASTATKPPWMVHGLDTIQCHWEKSPEDEDDPGHAEIARVSPTTEAFSFPRADPYADALYMVLMHPSVGLALAAWLNTVADVIEGFGDEYRTDEPPAEDVAAFTLARAVLRESDEVTP